MYLSVFARTCLCFHDCLVINCVSEIILSINNATEVLPSACVFRVVQNVRHTVVYRLRKIKVLHSIHTYIHRHIHKHIHKHTSSLFKNTVIQIQ